MTNIMRIDFETVCQNSDGVSIRGTERSITILWNKTVIDEDEVQELIYSGNYVCDNRIVVTTPIQADNLRGKKKDL